MPQRISHLTKKALNRYGSDGFTPLFNQFKRRMLYGTRQFKIYTTLRYQIQKRQYSAPADPYKPIWIAPEDPDYKTSEVPKGWGLGQIRGGNWDHPDHCTQLEDGWVFKGLEQRFEEGRDWEDTVYYDHAKQKFDNSNRFSYSGYRNLKQFREVRCTFVDNLFEKISEEGYRPNFDANHSVPEIDKRANRKIWQHRLEPLVSIGRDGDIYWRDGFHRYAIAKILEIEAIPVNIICRHKQWQCIRDDIIAAGNISAENPNFGEYIGHSDLEDIVGD